MAIPYTSSGTLPFGGKTVTINSVTYRVQGEWKPERKTRKIRRDDANGDQADIALRAEPTSQSGVVLQLATASTATPDMGMTMTVDTVVYVITACAKNEPQGDFHSVTIDYESTVLPTA